MGRNTNSNKSVTDYGKALKSAVTLFLTDGNGAGLQASYVAIPPAARGKAQLAAMPTALAAGPEKAQAILDLFTDLPTAPSRTARTTLSDTEKSTVLIGAMIRTLNVQLGFTVTDEMSTVLDIARDLGNTVTADLFSQVCLRVERAVADVTVTGERANKRRLSALVTDGTVPAGAKLTGTGPGEKAVSATVQADGQVRATVNGKAVTGAVSTVAEAVTGHPISGYVFWSYNGARLDTYQ